MFSVDHTEHVHTKASAHCLADGVSCSTAYAHVAYSCISLSGSAQIVSSNPLLMKVVKDSLDVISNVHVHARVRVYLSTWLFLCAGAFLCACAPMCMRACVRANLYVVCLYACLPANLCVIEILISFHDSGKMTAWSNHYSHSWLHGRIFRSLFHQKGRHSIYHRRLSPTTSKSYSSSEIKKIWCQSFCKSTWWFFG